jgi:uncharacterized SAM-binding protein YcdF (DUF218 family)
MEAYSILKQLLLPPGLLLLLLALAFLLVRGTLGRMVLFIAWSLLLLMSLPVSSGLLIELLETHAPLPPDAVAETGAEAIVVLGAGVYSDAPEYGGHTVDTNSMTRSRYAAWLHRRTGLPIYIAGGAGSRAPAPPMRRFLEQELGVPVAVVEDQSGNTRENAELTAPLLAAAGIGRVLLVTDAWHMPRALLSFKRVGVDVVPAPTHFVGSRHRLRDPADPGDHGSDWLPQASTLMASFYALHELLGGAYYALRPLLVTSPQPSQSRIDLDQ